MISSVTTVASAPVSNLKQNGVPSTNIFLLQILSPSQPIVLRNVISLLSCSFFEVAMPAMAFLE